MISKTLSVSPARKLRSDPGFPHISPKEMYHARPALLTVFSITQSDHSITLLSILDIVDLEMLPLLSIKSQSRAKKKGPGNPEAF
jgi:hypothetical protein